MWPFSVGWRTLELLLPRGGVTIRELEHYGLMTFYVLFVIDLPTRRIAICVIFRCCDHDLGHRIGASYSQAAIVVRPRSS